MQVPAPQILFLGEDSSWSALSQALSNSPEAPLRFRRVASLADLFLVLADGQSQAVVIDIHAWTFRGLHYVEKIRAEYPAFPIIALHSRSIPDLDAKASTCGASRCLPLDQLSADSLHVAIDSLLADAPPQLLRHKVPHVPTPSADSAGVTITFSKTQVITHALNNLLCVIAANADLLQDQLTSGSNPRPLHEIKKAAKSAAALMRHLK